MLSFPTFLSLTQLFFFLHTASIFILPSPLLAPPPRPRPPSSLCSGFDRPFRLPVDQPTRPVLLASFLSSLAPAGLPPSSLPSGPSKRTDDPTSGAAIKSAPLCRIYEGPSLKRILTLVSLPALASLSLSLSLSLLYLSSIPPPTYFHFLYFLGTERTRSISSPTKIQRSKRLPNASPQWAFLDAFEKSRKFEPLSFIGETHIIKQHQHVIYRKNGSSYCPDSCP